MKLLLAVDGSKSSLKGVECVIDHAEWYRQKPDVLLVTVQLPVPRLPNMGKVVGRAQIEKFYEDEGAKALSAAKRKLAAAGMKGAELRQGDTGQALRRIGEHAETLSLGRE